MADRRAVIAVALQRSYRALLVAFACVAATTPALAFVYSSEAVRLRVVEKGASKPLAGVIGVAIWEVEHPNWVTGTRYRKVAIQEAVSNEEGWMEFSAWKAERSWEAPYTAGAPLILLFHEDFHPIFIANEVTMERSTTQPTQSRWNGKAVELARAEALLERQARSLVGISVRLLDHRPDPEEICNFEKFPRMLAALDRMDERFKQASIKYPTAATSYRARQPYLEAQGCKRVADVIQQGALR